MSNALPKIYTDLADWWPILSAPDDYAEEAEAFRKAILSVGEQPPKTLLELGSGGGNNASHLKKHFHMTLVDIAEGMLDVSRKLNPASEHFLGDMRTVRLGRQFDAVFIHDAINYMITEDDLRSALGTAFEHCKPGGLALFVPDQTRETFAPRSHHGGHDVGERSLRYLEWSFDPDPDDTMFTSFMVYALREGGSNVRTVTDEHLCGLFAHADWMRIIEEVGFTPRTLPFEHSEIDYACPDMYLGVKPQ